MPQVYVNGQNQWGIMYDDRVNHRVSATAATRKNTFSHYNDVIMIAMASQITSLMIVYSTVYSGTDERKHQSSTSLVFMRGIHRWPVNSPHKGASNADNSFIWWRHHVKVAPNYGTCEFRFIRVDFRRCLSFWNFVYGLVPVVRFLRPIYQVSPTTLLCYTDMFENCTVWTCYPVLSRISATFYAYLMRILSYAYLMRISCVSYEYLILCVSYAYLMRILSYLISSHLILS